MAAQLGQARDPLAFARVNHPRLPGYVPGLQRHHLVPRSLAAAGEFLPLLDALGPAAGLDDFRRNGILLPASERGALRMGLPLHRGPHRAYTAMVRDRMSAIAGAWTRERRTLPTTARRNARLALQALQADLRRGLLAPARAICLNRHDPLGGGLDYSAIDAMADALWGATQREYGAALTESAAIAA